MRVLAPVVLLLAASLALAQVCSDPCLEAARGDYRECRKDVAAAFALGKQLCRDRDPACVKACAEREADCAAATGIGPALETCLGQQEAAREGCANRFPRGSKKREHCIDDARIDGFQCRNRARSAAAPELRRCRADFDACANACGPGEPPQGSRLCELDARRARSAAVALCNQTANADRSACVNKDAACTETCRDARSTCDEAPLASAVLACEGERRAAMATCEASNPGGGSPLEQCLEAADTAAFVCRNEAADAQAPAFASCVQQYVGCIRSCPPA